MEQKDIDRLNELKEKFNADQEYAEFERLSRMAWSEYNKSCEQEERSIMGTVKGAKYYLVLPKKRLDICQNGGWGYKQYGFDLEIEYPDGRYTCSCMAVCNKDVQYFVDRMLADKTAAEREEEGQR